MNQNNIIIPMVHRSLADLIGEIQHMAGKTDLKNITRTSFGDLQTSLNQSIFRLAVLGPWNSGKSSLINRLIGESDIANGLLPVKNEPTTAKLTRLSYGESAKLEKIKEDSEEPVVIASGEDQVRAKLKEEAVSKERASLLVEWPSDFCRFGGEIIDTPGLFDPDEERSMVTLDALEQFHAVIFVVPAPMPVDTDILRFIEEHFIKRTHAKFFFLINKVDWFKGKKFKGRELTIDEQLDLCHEDINKALAKRYNDLEGKGESVPDVSHLLRRERFFGVSSQFGDGLAQTSRAMRSFLSQGSKELVDVGLLKTTEVLNVLERTIDSLKSARHIEIAKLDQPLNDLKTINARFQLQMPVVEKSLPADFDKARERAGKSIRKMMQGLRDQGKTKLEYSFWQKIIKSDQIRQEMSALQRELIDDAEDLIFNMQEDLKKELNQILEIYHRDFIAPTVNELYKLARDLDETLASSARPMTANVPIGTKVETADIGGDKDSGVALGALGAGALGAGAGAAIAFGTGAAFTTTATVVGSSTAVVSTVGSWVPLAVAQALGMTTTVSTPIVATTTTMALGSLALWIAGPAAAAALSCLAIFKMIKSSKSIQACRNLLDELPEKHTNDVLANLKGEIDIMAKCCLSGMKDHVNGITTRLDTFIANLRSASQQDALPQGISHLEKSIQVWRDKLEQIKLEFQSY
jgi:hypothetical protein